MLRLKKYWNLDELVAYLDEHYGVIYKSKQSYYELLKAAGISWKKSQKVNPSSDPELVKKSRCARPRLFKKPGQSAARRDPEFF